MLDFVIADDNFLFIIHLFQLAHLLYKIFNMYNLVLFPTVKFQQHVYVNLVGAL